MPETSSQFDPQKLLDGLFNVPEELLDFKIAQGGSIKALSYTGVKVKECYVLAGLVYIFQQAVSRSALDYSTLLEINKRVEPDVPPYIDDEVRVRDEKCLEQLGDYSMFLLRQEGVLDLIRFIRSENEIKGSFKRGASLCFKYSGIPDIKITLASLLENDTEEARQKVAKRVCSQMDSRGSFMRPNAYSSIFLIRKINDKSISESLKRQMEAVISIYNKSRTHCKTVDDKIRLIVGTVQYALRLKFFEFAEECTIVLGMMNLLLIKENIGFSGMAIADMFKLFWMGLDQAVARVRKYLFSFAENQLSADVFCERMIAKINSLSLQPSSGVTPANPDSATTSKASKLPGLTLATMIPGLKLSETTASTSASAASLFKPVASGSGSSAPTATTTSGELAK